jgi:hypothetical protein
MRRTLLGLYFHETGVRLPDTHLPIVFSAAGLQNLNSDQQASPERVVKIGRSGRIRTIGDGVFTYSLQGVRGTPHCSVWLFLLYKRIAFIGFTVRREDFSYHGHLRPREHRAIGESPTSNNPSRASRSTARK